MDYKQIFKVLKRDYKGWTDEYKFVINNLSRNIPFAYARFNDGEMQAIHKVGSVVSRGDQIVDLTLQTKLKEALLHQQLNYYIGIPCSNCFPQFHQLAKQMVNNYHYTTSAVALTNRNWAKFISELSQAIKQPVTWVSGSDQKTDILESVLEIPIKVHHRYPHRNTWTQFEEILPLVNNFAEGDIVFISLGPTARGLVYEWFKSHPGITFIDVGSIFDPFTRNIWHRYHRGWEKGFNQTPRCPVCN